MHSLRNEEEDASVLHKKKQQKNNELIFPLAWNIMFTVN